MLNRASPVPLYFQLAEAILAQVRRGELLPGQQLPAERELSEHYGISRMTVRQAIQYLIAEGVLSARQGLGTFVAEPKLSSNPVQLLGFSEEMIAKGEAPASRVLEQKLVIPSQAVAAALGLGPRAQAVKIARLRLSGDEPLLLETVHVPAALCPGLEQADLATHSLYALLEGQYGLRLDRTHQALEATVANEAEAAVFGVAPGLPMLLVRGVTYLDDDRPVEHYQAVYRGDRFRFEFDSHRAAWMLDGAAMPGARPSMSVILRS